MAEAVGQVVLGQYGVHLRVVLAARAQVVDQLAHGRARPLGPILDPHDQLVPVVYVGIELSRQVDVHGDAARVNPYEDRVAVRHGRADVVAARTLDDGDDLALLRAVFRDVHHDHLHLVAVQGIGRIALVDEDLLLLSLDLHVDRAAGGHLRNARQAGAHLSAQAVFEAGALLHGPLFEQPLQDIGRFAAAFARVAARGGGEVLEGELVIRKFPQQIQDHGLTVVRPAGLFLSFCHCFRKFKASRFMKSMPVCMAPSRGENEAVWVRPAPGPTPSR